MRRASPIWFWATTLVALWCAGGCKRDKEFPKRAPPTGSPSAEQLDGMQLSAARRVGLESAIAAMEQRNLTRLQQLSVWVRNRAHVSVFEPDDLKALDLAIQCLEQVAPPTEALASLAQLKSGKLKDPARSVCLSRAEK